MSFKTTPMSKNVFARFLRSVLICESAACRSRTVCLMPSAFSGVRMVARALPGSGGSAARALASAACLAACRAAHGAAPRKPSLRLRGSSFADAAPLPGACLAAAEAVLDDALLAAAAFFVLAMKYCPVRCKAPKMLELRALAPPFEVLVPGGDADENAWGQLPESRGARLHAKCAERPTSAPEVSCGLPMAVLTAIDERDGRALLEAYGLGSL